MSSLIELSVEYRYAGRECRRKLLEQKRRLKMEDTDYQAQVELRRRITLLTAMARDCLYIANYLKDYDERREALEKRRNAGDGA